MKNKFYIFLFATMGILAIFNSSCSKDDDGISTFTVTYSGNNNTDGSIPIDKKTYQEGATVTVLGNSGNLRRTGYSFSGWNSVSDGTGIDYASDSTFTISKKNALLYAKWIKGGVLTVKISNASSFNNHSIYYSIYKTNAINPISGLPSGNIVGQGQLDIINNVGSAATVKSVSDTTIKVFENGTYYLSGMVDMNDNAEIMNYSPDSGDKYGNLITVVINGDIDLTITEEQFPIIIP